MAVVLHEDRILSTVEIIYGRETLSLPKGHQEINESLIETAIRECFEETNVLEPIKPPIHNLTKQDLMV